MSIVIKTNLDRYKDHMFPQNLSIVPRIGERVEIVRSCQPALKYPYPISLEVVSVTHTEKNIEVDVWYDKSTHDHLLAMKFDI